MRITCESIGFKNFLSFGSRWQDITLKNGVNIVTGYDKDKDKSNGAGKSSFLESIPFALYGKTARDIKQDQIVNWKNRKQCEVVFRFSINDDVFEIMRALKPNKLEIYKNGTMLDQDAKKTDYQAMFEENIFGIDMKMFMALIHSNVNSSSANIMNMSKPEKRVFIEKMFGLGVYSNMNQICNDKLRGVDNKLYKYDTDINLIDTKIETAKKTKEKLKYDINQSQQILEEVKEAEEKLKEIKSDNSNIETDIESTEKEIEKLKEDKTKVELTYNKQAIGLQNDVVNLKQKILDVKKLQNQIKDNERIKKYIKTIEDNKGTKEELEEKFGELSKESDEILELLPEMRKSETEINTNLVKLTTSLDNLVKMMDKLKSGVCPVCKQDVTNPKNHYKNEIAETKKKITAAKKLYTRHSNNIEKNQKRFDELRALIVDVQQDIKNLYKAYDSLKEINIKEDIDKLESELELKESQLKNLDEASKKVKEDITSKISSLYNKLRDLKEENTKIKSKEKELDILKGKAETEKKHIKSFKEQDKEQDKEIEKFKHEKHMAIQGIGRINDIKDYINAMKTILLDKNIKQFSIKQIMPYLNKQANHYLSEVNYSFYVNIDNWLDVDIRGPGIVGATYNSLSGGERRGIDLSIQLSLLDIERTQAGIFPDLLIFDELLDSSIDSKGINEVLNIVKIKQKEFGGKVFIISHRPEIDSDIIGNTYHVIKENGYSKVIV